MFDPIAEAKKIDKDYNPNDWSGPGKFEGCDNPAIGAALYSLYLDGVGEDNDYHWRIEQFVAHEDEQGFVTYIQFKDVHSAELFMEHCLL